MLSVGVKLSCVNFGGDTCLSVFELTLVNFRLQVMTCMIVVDLAAHDDRILDEEVVVSVSQITGLCLVVAWDSNSDQNFYLISKCQIPGH